MQRFKYVVYDTNFWTGVGSILLAVVLYSASFDIKEMIATRVGASFLPRIVAGALTLLGAILVFGSLRCVAPRPARQQNHEERVFGGLPAVLLSALLMCAYVGLMESLGFVLTSSIYIFLQILILAKEEKRNYLAFILISIILPIAVYYLFVNVFKVMIPGGILS